MKTASAVDSILADVGPVLHLPVSYLPWTVGGKEVYCHRLGKELRRRGIDSRVVVHSDSLNRASPGAYEHEGVPVQVLEPVVASRPRAATYSCAPDSIPGFEEILFRVRPRIVHFHDFSFAGASLLHMRAARDAGARIVMAYQSVGQTCLQRSLWIGGDPARVCDGWIEKERCTRCRLSDRGTPELVAALASKLAFLSSETESRSPLLRFLSASQMTAHFVRAWQECVSLVDMFHTGAAWAAELLVRNDVPRHKVRHIRHGVAEFAGEKPPASERVDGVLTVGIVGRSDPAKGHHVLIEAVRNLPTDAPIRVVLIGPVLESEYGRKLEGLIGNDERFEVKPPVKPSALMQAIRELDVLAVPSLWMETGPQVVLDAFAAGVPVIGSRLGGIPELVRDGLDGLLFEAGNSQDMARVLGLLLNESSMLDRMKAHIPRVRHATDVAEDILALYAELNAQASKAVLASG